MIMSGFIQVQIKVQIQVQINLWSNIVTDNMNVFKMFRYYEVVFNNLFSNILIAFVYYHYAQRMSTIPSAFMPINNF